jgi:hypothetical protein
MAGMLSALLALPTPAFAQGFEFDEEESETVTETAEEEDDGGMNFTSEDLSKEDRVEEKMPTVAILAVPGPAMDPERRQAVQAKMLEVGGNFTKIIVAGPETILPALEYRGMEECVTDPLCLGTVGEEAQVDRILLGRVRETADGIEFGVDYFEVKDRLFIAYETRKDVSSTSSIVDAVEPSMRSVFGIRDRDPNQNYVGTEDSSVVQSIIAYGAAGLAVVSLGAGIYFGMDASSKEDELVNGTKNAAGVYTITQKAATEKLREAESSATTANVFYGLATALTVTSVVFFIIRGGSDVGEERADADLIHDVNFAPIFTESGAGFGASFSF